MFAAIIGLVQPFVQRFRRDDSAVVAIQVVIFSVMLLTSAGLVIDFGRAYSAHSQMQSFVDKAALAAAAELDGQSDSIQRATAAAVAVAQSSSFTDDEEDFAIALPLTFMIDNPVDDTGTFSEAMMAELQTAAPQLATHVFVEAEARTIRLAFLSIGLNSDVTEQARRDIINEGTMFIDVDGDGTADASSQDSAWRQALAENTDDGAIEKTTSINLSAYAVARMQVSYCGEISTMVMCNPFEGNADGQSFTEIMENQEGTRMLLTTDRQADSTTPMPLSTNDGAIRVGLFKDPRNEIGADNAGVCDDIGLGAFEAAAYNGNPGVATSTDPWTYPATDEEMERLRDTCLLATIDSQMQCIGGEVLIKAAEPETITTALNSLFDIWDAPLDRILNQPTTSDRAFSPDYVANHGHLTRAEYIDYIQQGRIAEAESDMDRWSDRIANEQAGGNSQSRIERYQGFYDSAAAERERWILTLAAYPDNIVNTASRRNHMKGDGHGGAWGPMLGADCLEGDPSACTPYPYMALPFTEGDDSASGWRMGPLSAAPTQDAVAGDATEGSVEDTEADPAAEGDAVEGEEAATASTPDTDIISLGASASNPEITGWRIINYTDMDLTGRFGFETDHRSVIFSLPANSQRDYQVEVDDTAVITWTSEVELDLYLISAHVDTTQDFTGVGSPSYDIMFGRVPSFVEYFSTYYSPYMNTYALDLDNPDTAFEWDVAGSFSMYDGYSRIERQTTELLAYSASNGPENDDTAVRSLPEHFQFTSNNPSAEQTTERRRQNVALVNCEALSNPVSHSGQADAYAGAYVAELEAVVELFFTGPVMVQSCADTVGTDPEDQMDCWNSDIEQAYIPVEYLGAADPADPSVQEYLNYAVLVH